MKQGERASKACALFALALCMLKGLVTVSVFVLLRPGLEVRSSTPMAAVPVARPEVLVRLDRTSPLERIRQAIASARVEPAQQVQGAVAVSPEPPRLQPSPARHYVSAARFTLPDHGVAVLLASELSAEEPQLARQAPQARAPPGLGYVDPSPPAVSPRPLAGLFLPWATAPPLAG